MTPNTGCCRQPADRQVEPPSTHRYAAAAAGRGAIAATGLGFALLLPAGETVAQTALAAQLETGPDIACVGTRGYGVACLKSGAWMRWTRSGGELASDFVYAIAACRGRILVSAGRWLHELDRTGHGAMHRIPGGPARRIACDPTGGYWTTANRMLAKWTGRTWRRYDIDTVLKAARAGWVESMSVDRNGSPWVVAGGRIAARFDGNRWMQFTANSGLPARWRLTGVHTGLGGRLWLAHDLGLALRKGNGWENTAGPGSARVFADAPDGALWLGYLDRVTRFQDGFWTRYRIAGHAKGLVSGDDGRLWAATRYGLGVHDGKGWHWRRMANSELPSNDLAGIAVLGAGSRLPPPLAKPPGSLTFRLVGESGKALAGARVDLCAAPPGRVLRSARSPCYSRPFARSSKTDGSGRVSFDGLPPADYYPAILPQNGVRWLIGFSAGRTRVAAGQHRDAGDLRLRAADNGAPTPRPVPGPN